MKNICTPLVEDRVWSSRQNQEGSTKGAVRHRISRVKAPFRRTASLSPKKKVVRELENLPYAGTRLGEILIQMELITEHQLKAALRLQARSNQRIGQLLLKLGGITKAQLTRALSFQKTLRLAMASMVLLALCGCAALVGEPLDYRGRPTDHTPFDSKYEQVKKILERASSFRYQRETDGRDHWQLPAETEKLGGGDCEDMAIWLYAKLLERGLDSARLCIGVRTPTDRDMHCWVLWYEGEQAFLLDPTTRYGMVDTTRLPWGLYRPLYSYHLDRSFAHGRAAGANDLQRRTAIAVRKQRASRTRRPG